MGISDYQDEGIPDLKYAHEDAQAFASYLRTEVGGALDYHHLKVLINENATAAQFAIALDWLWEVVDEGDRVIIYFSGHGDVEKKSISQPGYLLCWDAPARVYMAGGTFSISNMKEVIATLSIQNKVEVVLITDACRAGKLSGSDIGGAQATSANLSKQFANEIKILSCQPDEYSLEGVQWGGGRGAFSYHLLDGLSGFADANNDETISLLEIGRYLEDKVSMEVAPHSQIPMTVGSKSTLMTRVDPDFVEQLSKSKKGQMQIFASTEQRGIVDEVLASVDTNLVELYAQFNNKLASQEYLSPDEDCAEYYYNILVKEPQLAKLHSSMRRNYAASLQDDAQQVMNTMLKTGLTQQVLKNSKPRDIYGTYPAYLERASELLGENHYMFSTLQARKFFFKGMIQDIGEDKRRAYRKAMEYQPEMAHSMVYMARSYSTNQLDSVMYFVKKAREIIPSWVEPYVAESDFYSKKINDPIKADSIIEEALKIDTGSVLLLYRRASLLRIQKKYDEALKWYDKLFEKTGKDICFPCAHLELGGILHSKGMFEEAVTQFKKTIAMDSTFGMAHNFLGMAYHELGRQLKAEQNFKKAIQIDSTNWQAHANLGSLYQFIGLWELAANATENAAKFGPPFGGIYAQLGNAYAHFPDGRKTLQLPSKRLKPCIPIGQTLTFIWRN